MSLRRETTVAAHTLGRGAPSCDATVPQLNALLPAKLRNTLATTSLTAKQVVGVDQQIDLFEGTKAASGLCNPRLERQAFFKDLVFVVEYHSLYDLPYTLELNYQPPDDPDCR
ncbi:hypothetical protein [Roseateles sp.]|uniref:hypothetical protein n=1 Tax=Roseateles sp. TaxID=1971397 RepID=UPI003264D916